jgi:hypothetical protein
MADKIYRFRKNPQMVQGGPVAIWDVVVGEQTVGSMYWAEGHWTQRKHVWAVLGQETVETDGFRTRDAIAEFFTAGRTAEAPAPKPTRATRATRDPLAAIRAAGQADAAAEAKLRAAAMARVRATRRAAVNGAPANLVQKGETKDGELDTSKPRVTRKPRARKVAVAAAVPTAAAAE